MNPPVHVGHRQHAQLMYRGGKNNNFINHINILCFIHLKNLWHFTKTNNWSHVLYHRLILLYLMFKQIFTNFRKFSFCCRACCASTCAAVPVTAGSRVEVGGGGGGGGGGGVDKTTDRTVLCGRTSESIEANEQMSGGFLLQEGCEVVSAVSHWL